MGPAIDALRPAIAVGRRNPAFLAVSVATLVGAGVVRLVVDRMPVVGDLTDSLFGTPAVAALLLGMAAAGLATNAATVSDGVGTLRSSYRSLLGAYAVLVVGVLVVVLSGAVAVAAVLFLGVVVEPAGGLRAAGSTAIPASGPVVAVSVVALAVALVGGLALQFFDVAVVVDDESALSAFAVSWRLYAEDPLGVVGYSVLRLVPVVAAGLVVGTGYELGRAVAAGTGGLLLAVAAAVLVSPPAFAFVTAYHVAYYEARTAGRSDGP